MELEWEECWEGYIVMGICVRAAFFFLLSSSFSWGVGYGFYPNGRVNIDASAAYSHSW